MSSTEDPLDILNGNTIPAPLATGGRPIASVLEARGPNTKSSRAAVLHGPKDLRIEPRFLPSPPPHYLQIKLLTTTLCGSDLHYFNFFRNGSIVPKQPLILGHESCGEVVEIGEGVDREKWKVGDKVALEVGVPCEECDLCLSEEGRTEGLGERYNLCQSLRFRSSGRDVVGGERQKSGLLEGTLQGGINHLARWCHKLPSNFSPDSASLLEPLSVAIHAVKRLSNSVGPTGGNSRSSRRTIIVFGAGPVGLLVSAYLKHGPYLSNPHIIIVDIVQSRLDFAVDTLKWADEGFLINLDEKLEPNQLAERIISQTSSKAPSGDKAKVKVIASFECTGSPHSLALAAHVTSPGGKMVVLGIPQALTTFPLGMATLREIDIIGSFRYSLGDYERAEEVASKGGIPGLGKLITHRIEGLENVQEAMELVGKGVDENGKSVVKVIVEYGQEDAPVHL